MKLPEEEREQLRQFVAHVLPQTLRHAVEALGDVVEAAEDADAGLPAEVTRAYDALREALERVTDDA